MEMETETEMTRACAEIPLMRLRWQLTMVAGAGWLSPDKHTHNHTPRRMGHALFLSAMHVCYRHLHAVCAEAVITDGLSLSHAHPLPPSFFFPFCTVRISWRRRKRDARRGREKRKKKKKKKGKKKMNSKKGIDKAEKRAAPIDAPIDVHFWIFEFFGFFGLLHLAPVHRFCGGRRGRMLCSRKRSWRLPWQKRGKPEGEGETGREDERAGLISNRQRQKEGSAARGDLLPESTESGE